jgi:amino acid transporter
VAVGLLLLVDAALSPTGTGWIYLGTATRSLFGWADEGGVPRSLRTLNSRGVPALALIVSTAVALVFLLPLPSWYLLVGFLSSATVLTYVVGSLAVPVLRSSAPELPRPFRLPWATVIAPAGFVAGLLVVYWAGFSLVSWLVAITAAGEVAFLLVRAGRSPVRRAESVLAGVGLALLLAVWLVAGPIGQAVGGPGTGALWSFDGGARDAATLALGSAALLAPWAYLWLRGIGEESRAVRAGGWIPGGLAAIFLLSYVGQYGPTLMANGVARVLPSARILPFPWDSLAAAAVAAAIYLVGFASARPNLGSTGASVEDSTRTPS